MGLIKDMQKRNTQRKANAFINSLKGKSDNEVSVAFFNNKEFHDNEIVLSYIFFNHTSLIKILPTEFQKERINSNLNMFSYGSEEVKHELIEKWISENKLINNALAIGFSDDEFSNYVRVYYSQPEDLTKLYMEDLKKVVTLLTNMDPVKTEEIISNNKDKFNDKQWEFIIKVKPLYIKYASQEIQKKYLNNEEYTDYLIGEAKEDYVENQVNKIKEDFSLFSSMDIDTRKQFIIECPYMINSLSKEDLIELLRYDIELVKHLNLSSLKEGKDETGEIICSILENLNEKSSKDIVNTIVSKNLLNAKGKLYKYDKESNNISYQYSKKVIKIIQSLNVNQIMMLIMVDTNYALPYIVPLIPNNATRDKEKKIIEESKNRCLELYELYFGKEILSNYKYTIESIYSEYSSKYNKYNYEEDYRCIFDLFKVLFNKRIITTMSAKKINEFIDYSIQYKDNTNRNIKFKISTMLNNILSKTYGVRIKKNAEIYNISSLEIFDSKLAFINDNLLFDFSKYNFVNISCLLLIKKSEIALKLFKFYYSIMTYLYGENLETLYKSIENFGYNKLILEDVYDKELTDTELNNLIMLLSDYTNKYGIIKKEQLASYDILLFRNLVNEISLVKDDELYKNLICRYLFGKCYNGKGDPGWLETDSIESLTQVFDIDSLRDMEIDNEKLFTEDEINLFIMTKLLFEKNDFDLLLSFVEKIISSKVKRNTLSASSLFNKMKQYRNELINNQIVSLEEIKELYVDRPDLVIKSSKDGVEVYTVVGQDFKVLVSDNDDGVHYYCSDVSKLDKNVYAYDKLINNGSVRFSIENDKTIIKLSKDSIKGKDNEVSYIIVVGKLTNDLLKIAKDNNLPIVEISME